MWLKCQKPRKTSTGNIIGTFVVMMVSDRSGYMVKDMVKWWGNPIGSDGDSGHSNGSLGNGSWGMSPQGTYSAQHGNGARLRSAEAGKENLRNNSPINTFSVLNKDGCSN